MRSRAALAAVFAVLTVAIAGGCGSSAGRASSVSSTTVKRAARTLPTRPTTTTSPPTTAPATTVPTTAPRPVTTTVPPTVLPTAPPPSPVTRLVGVGNASQVISVSASGYGVSTATLTAYEHDAGGWRTAFGPWTAYIGRNGFAPSGAKREGDGRTPSGAYGFSFDFGIEANPGLRFPYRSVTGPWIVWDDDPASPNYNLWLDDRTQSAGAAPEPMDRAPSYDYGAVIDYNAARTPGLGSAIFLHVSHGSPTAGCVSLPVDELLSVLRWLDPAKAPRIIMGTAATITS